MTDVSIVGGGPAGATLALRLARLGHAITVYERGNRAADGESLNPGIWPLFDSLGIPDQNALRIHRSLVSWSEPKPIEQHHPKPHLAVLRPSFDHQLLDMARAAGANILSRQPPTANRQLTADASGRASWSRTPRTRTSERTLAMRATFRGAGLPREMRVEALEDGWLWGSPMPDGSFAVIACVDADTRADAWRYHAMLRASQLFRDLRGDVAVHCHDATTYAADTVCGEGFLRLGDAAHSLDPLSSSGIRSAMQSALHASIVINTIIRRPERTALALRFYEDAQRAAVEQHQRWTREFYGESRWKHAPFWQKRAGVPPPTANRQPSTDEIALADGVMLADSVPCIVGDFVEARRGVTGSARPFVWIGGAEAASLLAPLERQTMRATELVASWRGLVPPGREQLILDELLRGGVVSRASP